MLGRPNTPEEQEMEKHLGGYGEGAQADPEQDVQNQDQALRDKGAE